MTTFRVFRKWAVMMLALISLVSVSCSRATEEPPAPTNESNTLGHDRWGKVEFIIRKGHLHGKDFHGNIDGDDPYFKSVQRFTFEVDDTGNIVQKNAQGKVLAKGEEPVLMIGHLNYSMEIVYYNKQGKRINNQFTTKEMLPIHQHFFTVKEYTDLNTGKTVVPKPDELMNYTYRDTNPEDIMIGNFVPGTTQASRLTNDPLGLKGYFTHKRGRVSYSMNVMLAHLLKGDKYTNNGKTWPFNEPSSAMLSVAVPDFSQSIPIVVVTTPTDGTPESFKNFIKEIAEYFKVSEEEVEKNMINGPVDESGAFWM